MSNTTKQQIIQSAAAFILCGVLAVAWSMYNDVQANSMHRINADKYIEQNTQTMKEMNTTLVELTTEVKYLRKDVQRLEDSQSQFVKAAVSDSNSK